MSSNATEDEAQNSATTTHFVQRRRPVESGNVRRATSSRPHSIGASIISNPKLVKGWQYYDNSLNQRDIEKYFSTVNLGASTDDALLEQEANSRAGASGTGTTSTRSGGGGSERASYTHNSTLPQGGGDNGVDNDEEATAATGLMTGVEIKACVAEEEDRSCCTVLSEGWGPVLGIFLTIVASIALALSTVLIECLPASNKYHPYTVLVWTSQGLFWPSLILLLCPCQMRSVTLTKAGLPTSKSNNKLVTVVLLLLRAILGWTAAVLSLEALPHIYEDNSYMVIWTSPVFVLLIAWFLLKEKPGVVPSITALVVVILGVGVIVRPSIIQGELTFDKGTWIGLSFAVGALLAEGVFSVIIIRHLRHVHLALVTFVYGLVGIIGGILLYYLQNDKFSLPVCTKDTLLAALICVNVFLGQAGITGALKYEKAGIVSVVRCWQVPMVVVWRFWFIFMITDWINWIGGLVIALGIFVLAARNLVEARPRYRRTQKWLGFLLL